MEPMFAWDADTGTASCILSDGQKTYCGLAQCHPNDLDMMSEKTGCEIAFRRAKIDVLRALRDDYKIRIKALNELYYSMKHSKKFNPNSYENKMLCKSIKRLNFDLETTKEMIASEQKNLKEYINSKDNFYKQIRARRQLGNNN